MPLDPRSRGRPPIRPLHARPALLVWFAVCVLAGSGAWAPARGAAGIPTGLAWCGGITDPAQLPACRAAGFTAVRLEVPWTPGATWEGLDRVIAGAQAEGLQVILSLRAASPPPAAGPVAPGNAEYLAQAKVWIQGVVERFRGTPNLLGWMLPDEPEAALRLTDDAFRAFLAERYGDLAGLNRAWGTRFARLTDVSANGSLILARQHPYGICRATLDVALFRQQGFVRLMQLWARFVRGVDPEHPILTGTIGAYRCLISVPEEYAAVNARVLPGAPESVAIARRNGRFAALAVLPATDPLGALGGALLQGASGIGVEDWRAVSADQGVQKALAAALAQWRRTGCVTAAPTPTTAILYEPFGESSPRPSPLLTGYLVGTDTGELDPLFTAFRQGTPFGQVGFLAREDLADRSRLAGIRVLLCPMALSLTADDIQTLFRFAESGGVVVADAGIGCSEAGGEVASWSTGLASLLGVLALHSPMGSGGPLRIYEKSALFPSIAPGNLSAAPLGVHPFMDPPVLIRPMEKSTVLGASVDLTTPGKRLFGGILLHPVGKGWVVYASTKLWQRWSPADPLYVAFHRDLMSRQPVVTLYDVPFVGGDVQVAAFERGVAVRNTGRRNRLAVFETPSEYLYAGLCLNMVRPATQEGVQVAAGLAPGNLGIYERTPIRCVIGEGALTVAVEEYGPEGIKLTVCGGRPRITLNQAGTAVMAPGYPQPARLIIGDGRYPVRPGSLHLLQARACDGGAVRQVRIRVGPDAKIEIANTFYSDVLSLTPLPDGSPSGS